MIWSFGLACILVRSGQIEVNEESEEACLATGSCVDEDLDGTTVLDGDCDDTNPQVSPTAAEVCDDIDNNCDGLIDEEDPEVQGLQTFYLDADGDGYGDLDFSELRCEASLSHVEDGSDCDDSNAQVCPTCLESCDGIDNDCDQLIDSDDPDIDFSTGDVFYLDEDGDGFGVASSSVEACEPPEHFAHLMGDCDDQDSEVYPNSAEVENDLIDQNCDGEDEASCLWGDCDQSVVISPSNRLDFVRIPAGSDPLGRYTISTDFFLMTTEVTQNMVEAFAPNQNFAHSGSLHPADNRTWHQAAQFANWVTGFVNQNLGLALEECYLCEGSGPLCTQRLDDIYSCSGFRLPTDAEWEYAARSGATKDFSTLNGPQVGEDALNPLVCNDPQLSEGTLMTDFAWYCSLEGIGTHPIVGKDPNPWGLYDIYGNVWEWTNDDGVVELVGENPSSTGGQQRTIRGGAFDSFPIEMTNDQRAVQEAIQAVDSVGLRLCRTDWPIIRQ